MPGVQRERRDKPRYGQGLRGCRPIRSLSDTLLHVHAAVHAWERRRDGESEWERRFSSPSSRMFARVAVYESENGRNDEDKQNVWEKKSFNFYQGKVFLDVHIFDRISHIRRKE